MTPTNENPAKAPPNNPPNMGSGGFTPGPWKVLPTSQEGVYQIQLGTFYVSGLIGKDNATAIGSVPDIFARIQELEAFVTKIACHIEPINSIVGYRDKESRARFAAKLRNEARELLRLGGCE